MISYSQNLEDVLLARVFRGQETGFYIDIGAMDPVEGSVTKHFYDLGWCGINIEPDERFHRKLVAERPRDLNLLIAVGDCIEERLFYQFESQGISTLREEFRQYFADRNYSFQAMNVPVTTLAEVCRQHVRQPIAFLKIDAEGWEGPIIRGADWKDFRPTVLILEATKPYSTEPDWHGWEPDLLAAGYVFVYFDGVNRFYLREESRALAEAFQYPPNVLDGFQLYSTVRLQQEQHALKAEAHTLQAEMQRLQAEVQHFQATATELKGRLDETWRQKEQEREILEEESRRLRSWLGRVSQEKAALQLEKDYLSNELALSQSRSRVLDELYTPPLTDIPHSQVTVAILDCPDVVKAGVSFPVRVEVINKSVHHLVSSGPNPVNLSYWWCDIRTGLVAERRRTQPYLPIRGRSTREYEMSVDSPQQSGRYVLTVCIVQELVAWFDEPSRANTRQIQVTL